MEENNCLSLLGLALRGRRLAVGADSVTDAARAGKARLIILSQDASERTRRNGIRLAETAGCLMITLPCSGEALGHSLGGKSVSVAALTDLGLAIALVRRLASASPEAFGSALEKLEIKSRRAAERKREGGHTGGRGKIAAGTPEKRKNQRKSHDQTHDDSHDKAREKNHDQIRDKTRENHHKDYKNHENHEKNYHEKRGGTERTRKWSGVTKSKSRARPRPPKRGGSRNP